MDNIVNFVDMEIDNNVLVNWVDHRNALLREFARIIELMNKAVEEGTLDVKGVEVLDPDVLMSIYLGSIVGLGRVNGNFDLRELEEAEK
jgi:hypothetical protein|tara:strand:- start:22059 stop:22325 length:267 start_codon:yes stop_codon:yes gene_type:complete